MRVHLVIACKTTIDILSGIQFAITLMCQTMSDMQKMRLFIYLREFDEEYPWLG